MKTLIPFAALAALFPLVPVTATATAAPPLATQVVSYRDLDLGTAAGRAKLDRRLDRAAQSVCGTASDFDLVGQRKLRQCRISTADTARTAVAAKASTFQVAAAGR